ncbi:MAG: hypothetical protein AUK47_23755 [Deltaproteobacteria bacterium CG2_30_63_29]|nr:MAG: hypothetical protein AUK47_23755 [Deltaproteobacteria bacterium CG2_30_63_29]PIW01162.1 MAG: hypothetical protein COW42_05740 [Deltaproteobacteria bacterium CG17_big_fil_post_rev_8_21_14_2_50_63_7]PJB44365.1 MAG: hypothetical protein CO108_08760 [Deltaproteobacteria bacterium CG_4_9_14_3_um_filter_63_12]
MLDTRLAQLKRTDEVVHTITPSELNAGEWWAETGRDWPGHLSSGLIEPRKGYRFRPENLALSVILDGVECERLVDLGTGSGALLLIADAFLEPSIGLGLELQSDAVERLGRTLEAHQRGHLRAEQGDLREDKSLRTLVSTLGGKADVVVMNPPFFPSGWGRASSLESVHRSTHALHGDVFAFLEAAKAIVSDEGMIFVVFDATRMASLFAAAGKVVLEPDRIVMIPNRHQAARADEPYRVWVRFRQGSMLRSL